MNNFKKLKIFKVNIDRDLNLKWIRDRFLNRELVWFGLSGLDLKLPSGFMAKPRAPGKPYICRSLYMLDILLINIEDIYGSSAKYVIFQPPDIYEE